MKFTRIRALIALTAMTQAASAVERLELPRADGGSATALHYPPAGICRGTAILSHGAGGSENGLAYLAEFLQASDWLVVVPGHAESGRKALLAHTPGLDIRAGLAALITDADAYRHRFSDIEAAREWAQARCPGRFSALIGHSMGAATVMLLAGARNRLGLDRRIDFDAYVAMSPQGVGAIFPPDAWSNLSRPVYTLTGTEDRELNAPWTTRLQAYRDMQPGCKWLGVVDGAKHMAFGRGGTAAERKLINWSVQSFLQAVQSGDCRNRWHAPGIRIEYK